MVVIIEFVHSENVSGKFTTTIEGSFERVSANDGRRRQAVALQGA